MEPVVFGFDEVRQDDAEKVGKKCANLGELTFAGFRVPPGILRLARGLFPLHERDRGAGEDR